ncbi:acid phosphatase [Paraburkholderia phosphatilytica]|uniref:acid phosphatase n=1 Tax=Paraburkholderia phosphatilytica TaxID=2282883 RepID=UPI000E507166|nr:acid phosphatase [Paraburkholderia phosphatilytica]
MTDKPPVSTAPSQPDGPEDPERRRVLGGLAAFGMGLALGGCQTPGASAANDPRVDAALRGQVRNIVVIYAENRSFANLYGHFPGVRHPLSDLSPDRYVQLDRDGKTPLPQLPKIWGGLVPQTQTVDGTAYHVAESDVMGLRNGPFLIPDAQGKPLPNGVITRDLWHRFYQNQMQINSGRNDQFVAWADSGGLVMGHYRSNAEDLKLWNLAQQYTLCDNFFMAAFGGSWLNHLFLISAQAPYYPDAANSNVKHLLSVVDGDPTSPRLKIAADSPASALDGPPKFVRDGLFTADGYAVNTMAPPYEPSNVRPAKGGDPRFADPGEPRVLRPQNYATIGDRLSDKGIDWAWYSGAWQFALDHWNEDGAVPDFQYHHQPFNYFASFAPGTAARAQHLRDGGMGDDPSTNRFIADIDAGRLPAVTFYKPQGNLNMHAGYADVASGDRHIANIIEHLQHSPQWQNTVVIVTVDENGGWWDPVAPPKGDRWGPGSRIPALVISSLAKTGHVDHTFYDTGSILRFITRVHQLTPLDGVVARDRSFADSGATPPGDLTLALQLV